MTEAEINKLTVPELNKQCVAHGVNPSLPLVERRKALFAALSKKTAKPGPAKPAAPKPAAKPVAAAKPGPAKPAAKPAAPAPKPAPAAKTSAGGVDVLTSTVTRMEATVNEMKKSLADVAIATKVDATKLDNTFRALFAIVGVPSVPKGQAIYGMGKTTAAAAAPAAKPAASPEEEEVEVPDDGSAPAEAPEGEEAATEIPESIAQFLSLQGDGTYALDISIKQVAGLNEEQCRALLDVLAVDHSGVPAKQVRKVQAMLTEALNAASGGEAPAEEPAEQQFREVTAEDCTVGAEVKFKAEDGEWYDATIADPDTFGQAEVEGAVRILFTDGESFMDAVLGESLVMAA